MKYSLIGCGRISPNHIAAAKKNGIEITLCDIVPERMEKLINDFDLPKNTPVYTNYNQMLVKEEPKLITIATESGKHAAIALECIEAGCHLIIEKPIALSLEDADKIIDQAKKKNIKVCACHQNRFNKAIQKIRSAVEENKFGRMLYGTAHILWNRGQDYYNQAKWRGIWEQDGGALMNQCIHNIDLLRWMMGSDIEKVFGMTGRLCHDYIEAEDLGVALIRFKNGAFGLIEGTTNVYPKNLEETLYLFGEKGTVKAGGKSVNIIEEWRFENETDHSEQIKAEFSENPPNVYGFGHTPLYTDVIDAIKNDRNPYIDAEDGRRAIELVLAIYKSAFEDKPVYFPLNHCKTTDFYGQFD